MSVTNELVGLVPAAGTAKRVSPLPATGGVLPADVCGLFPNEGEFIDNGTPNDPGSAVRRFSHPTAHSAG